MPEKLAPFTLHYQDKIIARHKKLQHSSEATQAPVSPLMMKVEVCHDCKEVRSPGAKYEHKGVTYFKCKPCYKKNKSLTKFQPCEVYSRIVGYLRPVKQWNVGKQEEYKNRKTYK